MIHKFKYIQWLELRELQPRTIKEYNIYLDHLADDSIKFDQDNVDAFTTKYKGNIARSFIRSYKTYLLRNPDSLSLTPKAVNKIRSITVENPKTKARKIPSVITEEEMKKIYNKMPSDETKVMLKLSFYCGLRRQELITLKASMFSFVHWLGDTDKMGLLNIIGKGNKEGFIPVKAEVMGEAYELLPPDYKETTALFDTKPRTWNNILSRAAKEGIGRHIKPHTLRHSAAMHLRGRNFAIDEIKEFLRHEDISTTQIYSRVTPQQLMDKFKDL